MKENTYETNDFSLAVTLLALGYVIVDFNTADPQRVFFIFEEQKGLANAVNDFWRNQIKVNPKTLFLCQKELKARMNQFLR